MKRLGIGLTLLVAALLVWGALSAWAIEKIDPDPKGVELVNKLMKALTNADETKRLQEVLPLVHKSLKSKDGKDLDRTVKDFSYKKACTGAGNYKIPVEIHEVHKGTEMTIGFKETAETGRKDKYFVKKKDGVAGMPAPIIVFWPKGGGAPLVVDMGSL
jgi:hypothetical protein